MILTGNVAALSGEVQCGNVVGPVAVLKLDSAGSCGKSEQLMSEADSEDGDLRVLHQLSEVIDSVLTMSWITRPIGDEDAVEVVCNLVNGIVEGEDCDAGAATDEASKDILLDTTVDDSHVGSW